MFRPRKRGAALVAAVLAAGLTTPAAPAAPAAPPATSGAPAEAPRTVTLITGDRVVVTGAAVGAFQPGPGREGVVVHSTLRDGRLQVVPEDALKGIAAGRLDPRLFDVTGLIEAGYDDAHRDTVPLIVTGTPTAGLGATTALPAAGAVAAEPAKAEAGAAFRDLLADPGVTKVWLDGVLRPTLDRSTAQIGAPTAWRSGLTGKGVKVAVLDGGVDGDHPDLKGREIAERNFTDAPDNVDHDGHGTHVAATIASNDAKYRGVAPGAAILDGKVCRDGGCQESSVLAGMQWAVDQGADIVNLSLGGYDSPGVDPMEEAVNRLSDETGTLFVVAAGNSGRAKTVDSPGSADAALTVGAVRRDDDLAYFSSRGPRTGDGAVKPDITAPGVNIVAAKASQGTIGTPVGRRHVSLSGTSMATPHVAGAAALLAQQHPDWTGARIKSVLMASARPNPALTVFEQGTGRVDLTRAITATVGARPVSLAFGEQQWPHQDDAPVTKTVTYRNSGPQPVTFDLAVDLRGPDGRPAPAGLVTVTPATVTVPAGGEAAVAVTADTRVGTTDGLFAGAVVGGPTRTPLSLAREVESYDVSVAHLDAEGNPAPDHTTALVGMDNDVYTSLYDFDGTATARVPKGEYMARTVVRTGNRTAVLARPSMTVDADHTLFTFDARTAAPIDITPPAAGATPAIGDINVSRLLNGRRVVLNTAFLSGFVDMSIGHVGPVLTDDELTVSVGAQYQAPPVDGTAVNYRFRWVERGEVPTGFTRAPTEDELAEVRTTFAPAPADRQHLHSGNASPPDGSGGWSALLTVPGGGAVVDHITTDELTWGWSYLRLSPQYRSEADYSSYDRTYQRDGRYAERFLFPVMGPGLSALPATYLGLDRDRVTAQVPLFNDRDGNLGRGSAESARTALYRDGRLVGLAHDQVGQFTVEPGEARYRVEQDIARDPTGFELGTRASGAWTFRTDVLPAGQGKRLPLSVVRFTPELDASGGTPAGRLLRVPLTVEQQQGADNGEVGRIRVEVSFDDGKSWAAVPVAGGAALVRSPNAAGYASLRASGTDSKGNTFEQTLIRAYEITK
ncbi:S8 family serine peptidase [Saccharothrix syringae]|uniref:Peptidase S8 n=1 Tax=Saccharothrix syringae TaxID=103733 RepID=A0A5Q0GUN0_SACSY|nr:S8 family serine peptidase [Saccharothrix syringae]QFZ17621.1 peptidase S8 [Saccharothrix syringae]